EEDLIWARLDREPFPELAAEDISGIILGGSPFTVSEPDETKSAAELRAEKEIFRVLDHVFEQDIPFFGACDGIGTLGTHHGALLRDRPARLPPVLPDRPTLRRAAGRARGRADRGRPG